MSRTFPNPVPQEDVRVPMLRQSWHDVSFLHWPFDPGTIQRLLPDGLTVDTFDGAAWVGLTPFRVTGSRPAVLPPVPRLADFPETNLRTYVVGPDGRDGLWFLSIEAASLPTTLAARSSLSIPYHWADMSIDRSNDVVAYRSRRRTEAVGNTTLVTFESELRNVDRRLADWLSGRWRAWIRPLGRLATVAAEHQPWPLVDARVEAHDDNLLEASGLPRPDGAPTVFAARRVDAALGWPQRAV